LATGDAAEYAGSGLAHGRVSRPLPDCVRAAACDGAGVRLAVTPLSGARGNYPMRGSVRPVLDNLVRRFPNAPFEISIASSAAAARAMESWCLVLVARMVGWMNRTCPPTPTRGCEHG
jgi:hypothetical protein